MDKNNDDELVEVYIFKIVRYNLVFLRMWPKI